MADNGYYPLSSHSRVRKGHLPGREAGAEAEVGRGEEERGETALQCGLGQGNILADVKMEMEVGFMRQLGEAVLQATCSICHGPGGDQSTGTDLH